MSDFKPNDHVRARLWPELGTGRVLHVTTPQQVGAPRIAKVDWPEAHQVSRHDFVALALVETAVHA